jgi:hypothetical protein
MGNTPLRDKIIKYGHKKNYSLEMGRQKHNINVSVIKN